MVIAGKHQRGVRFQSRGNVAKDCLLGFMTGQMVQDADQRCGIEWLVFRQVRDNAQDRFRAFSEPGSCNARRCQIQHGF